MFSHYAPVLLFCHKTDWFAVGAGDYKLRSARLHVQNPEEAFLREQRSFLLLCGLRARGEGSAPWRTIIGVRPAPEQLKTPESITTNTLRGAEPLRLIPLVDQLARLWPIADEGGGVWEEAPQLLNRGAARGLLTDKLMLWIHFGGHFEPRSADRNKMCSFLFFFHDLQIIHLVSKMREKQEMVALEDAGSRD